MPILKNKNMHYTIGNIYSGNTYSEFKTKCLKHTKMKLNNVNSLLQ